MTTFPSTIKFQDINIDTSNTVVSDITSLSGKREVVLGEQHNMIVDLKTYPLTEIEDKGFQVFINEIRNYGLIDLPLDQLTVFKPISTSSTKMNVAIGNYPIGSKTIFIEESGVNLKVGVGSWIQFQNRSGTQLSKLYQIIKIEQNVINIQNNNTAQTRLTLNTGLIDPLISYLGNNYVYDVTSQVISYTYSLNGTTSYSFITGNAYANYSTYSFAPTNVLSLDQNIGYKITSIDDSTTITGTPNVQQFTLTGNRSNVRRPGSNEVINVSLSETANTGPDSVAVAEQQKLYYIPGTANSSSTVDTNIQIWGYSSTVKTQPNSGSNQLIIEQNDTEANILTTGGQITVETGPLPIEYENTKWDNYAYNTILFSRNANGTDCTLTFDAPAAGPATPNAFSLLEVPFNDYLYTFVTSNGLVFQWIGSSAITRIGGTSDISSYVIPVGNFINNSHTQLTLGTSAGSQTGGNTTASSRVYKQFTRTYDYTSFNPISNTFTLTNNLNAVDSTAIKPGFYVKNNLYNKNFKNGASNSTIVNDICTTITNNSLYTVTDHPSDYDQDNYLLFTRKVNGAAKIPFYGSVNNNGETNTYTPQLKLNNYYDSQTGFSTLRLNSTTTYDLNSLTFSQITQTQFNASGLNNTSFNMTRGTNTSHRFLSLNDTTNIYRDTTYNAVYLYRVNVSGGTTTLSYDTAWYIHIDPNTVGYSSAHAEGYLLNVLLASGTTNYNMTFVNLISNNNYTRSGASGTGLSYGRSWQKILPGGTFSNLGSGIQWYPKLLISGSGGTFRWNKTYYVNNLNTAIEVANFGSPSENITEIALGLALGTCVFYQGATKSDYGFIVTANDVFYIKQLWLNRPPGEEWFIAMSDILQTYAANYIDQFQYLKVTSFDINNSRIYISSQSGFSLPSKFPLTGVFTLAKNVYNYSTIPADGTYTQAIISREGYSSSNSVSLSFDPDINDVVYTESINDSTIDPNSNYSSILTQIGTKIKNLNTNFSWNSQIISDTSETVTTTTVKKVTGRNSDGSWAYGDALTSTTGYTGNYLALQVPFGNSPGWPKLSPLADFLYRYPLGSKFSVNGQIFTPTTQWVTLGSATLNIVAFGNTITVPASTQVYEVTPAKSKITIDLGTDINISSALSIRNREGSLSSGLIYSVSSTDAIGGSGTSSTYSLKNPSGEIVKSFTSYCKPILQTSITSSLLNLGSNYSIYYDNVALNVVIQSLGNNATLLTDLQTKLNDGGIYYIGGTLSNNSPVYGNRILTVTYTTTPTNRLILTTYAVPVGLPIGSGSATYNHYVFYENGFTSDYIDVLNGFKPFINNNIEVPVNYLASSDNVNKTFTLTSSTPENITMDLWSVAKNNNGVTGADTGNIQVGGAVDGTFYYLNNIQPGTRIISPPAKKVTLENLDDLATLEGYSMGKPVNSNELPVSNVDIANKIITFDSASPYSPTSLSWSVGDIIYRSRGLSPIRYIVTSITGNNIYLNDTAGLNIGDYITADLNSASSVDNNKVYKILSINVEFDYITLERSVIPSTITSIINSSTSSIRKIIGNTVSSAGTGYDIVSVDSGASKVYLQTLYNLKVGDKLTTDNSSYNLLYTATITTVNDDGSVTLNSIPTTFITNAELYLVSENFSGYKIVSVNNNIITLSTITNISVNDRLSISNVNTSQGFKILSIDSVNKQISLDALTSELTSGGYVANAEVFIGKLPVVNNLTVTAIDRLTHKIKLNYTTGLTVGDYIVGNDLKTVTVTTSGNANATQFNGTYTQFYHIDYLSFIYRSTIYDPNVTSYGPVPGSVVYKKNDADIYLWNRYDSSTDQGGWHITYKDAKNPNVSWMYFRQNNSSTPQTNTLGASGIWYVVNPGLYASEITPSNISAVTTNIILNTLTPIGTQITNISGNVITVDDPDIIGNTDYIRKGTTAQPKSKICHKDLVGKFRLIDGNFNSTSSYLLADGTQMKTYRFKLIENI